VARDTTNLTPDQLEEFEAVFLHFDRDRTNLLGATEFAAALASLGLNYPPKEMEDVFREVSGSRPRVNFEQFIRFMVELYEDSDSAEQVLLAFRDVADGKVPLL
jgi:Ca2+-binding EF-hand superfamily protein